MTLVFHSSVNLNVIYLNIYAFLVLNLRWYRDGSCFEWKKNRKWDKMVTFYGYPLFWKHFLAKCVFDYLVLLCTKSNSSPWIVHNFITCQYNFLFKWSSIVNKKISCFQKTRNFYFNHEQSCEKLTWSFIFAID